MSLRGAAFANESNSQMWGKPARQFPSFRDEATPHRGAGGPALPRDPCDASISLMGQPHSGAAPMRDDSRGAGLTGGEASDEITLRAVRAR